MPTTIKIPFELLTVQINSANSFWTAKSGGSLDQSYVAFVDSGLGVATYWCYVPNNLATSPLWNVDLHHMADTGSGGNVIFSAHARALSTTSTIDIAPTIIVNSGSIAVNTSNWLTVSAASGANFDSVVAISATNIVLLKCFRHASTSGDTVDAQWDLLSPIMRCDVT